LARSSLRLCFTQGAWSSARNCAFRTFLDRNFPRNAAPQWRDEIAAAQELHAIVAVLSA
jgi:hypothetical protein